MPVFHKWLSTPTLSVCSLSGAPSVVSLADSWACHLTRLHHILIIIYLHSATRGPPLHLVWADLKCVLNDASRSRSQLSTFWRHPAEGTMAARQPVSSNPDWEVPRIAKFQRNNTIMPLNTPHTGKVHPLQLCKSTQSSALCDVTIGTNAYKPCPLVHYFRWDHLIAYLFVFLWKGLVSSRHQTLKMNI